MIKTLLSEERIKRIIEEKEKALKEFSDEVEKQKQKLIEIQEKGRKIVGHGEIGEIRFSLLDEKLFQKKYGKQWVLMKGQEIVGSDLAQKTPWNELPDARGKFIRMVGGKSKPMGIAQSYATAMPSNDFTDSTDNLGNHNHTVEKRKGYLGAMAGPILFQHMMDIHQFQLMVGTTVIV